MKKLPGAKQIDVPDLLAAKVEVFARRPHESGVSPWWSVFRSPGCSGPLPAYSGNASTRAYVGESLDLWTTEKKGVRLGQFDTVREALLIWQDVGIQSKDAAIAYQRSQLELTVAKNVIDKPRRGTDLEEICCSPNTSHR